MSQVEREREIILDARQRGAGPKFWAFTKLSGPGWLQGAITLGGGSLGGSLYLGVIGGYQMMWLQPLMMILGIVMLSVIGYVTLSTGERPFQAINRHINPVLGWGWVIATALANLVWAMPQFSLGSAALRQNLGLFEWDGGRYVAAFLLFAVATAVVWSYDSGGRAVKVFDILLKVLVGIIVLSFFGVVVAMTFSAQGLAWGEILSGFIPNPRLLFEPAAEFQQILQQTEHSGYWSEKILGTQRTLMVAAAATAVGINMTFLLPYSMLKRGWDRDFRGLATFDLSVGLFLPFLLATSCVVIASATQFHGKPETALLVPAPASGESKALEKLRKDLNGRLDIFLQKTQELSAAEFKSLIEKRAQAASGLTVVAFKELDAKKQTEWRDEAHGALRTEVDRPDLEIAAMLVKRDSNVLANSLEPLTGPTVAHVVFGVGVLGMAVSTIIILMLINGFAVCEMFGKPLTGPLYRFGCLLPGLTGSLGWLFLWGKGNANVWLVVPTSVFGMVLLPIAYLTFFLMMNSESLLGEYRPRGGRRLAINAVMSLALGAATVGAGWSIWDKAHEWGVAAVVGFLALAGFVHLRFPRTASGETPAEETGASSVEP